MLGSQSRLSAVLSALLIASLHPLPGLLFASDSFRARLRMADRCLHGSLWYHGVAVYLAVLSLRVRCCRTVVGGRYLCLPLPYRRWGTVSVLIAAIPSLGNGICAYCCHTIIVRWYMCFSTAVQTLGGWICAYLLCRCAKVCLLCSCCSCLHSYAINVCGSLCVTSA